MKSTSEATQSAAYVAPRITSYDERQVAEDLGPVMLSGTGTRLGELAGDSPSAGSSSAKPRR